MKKDLYTLFIFKDGTRFYFKNNKLHRENGPAIISAFSASTTHKDYSEDIDVKLYNKVFPKNSSKPYFVFKFSDASEIIMESPIQYIYKTSYYIENQFYSEEKFKEHQKLKIKEELENTLILNELITKKLKL